ncbi:hypothetical protein JHW43_006567 [Diplocarpon mali]|nr:hypothetical protein JHW43_006567 [Diplocarpon mali]
MYLLALSVAARPTADAPPRERREKNAELQPRHHCGAVVRSLDVGGWGSVRRPVRRTRAPHRAGPARQHGGAVLPPRGRQASRQSAPPRPTAKKTGTGRSGSARASSPAPSRASLGHRSAPTPAACPPSATVALSLPIFRPPFPPPMPALPHPQPAVPRPPPSAAQQSTRPVRSLSDSTRRSGRPASECSDRFDRTQPVPHPPSCPALPCPALPRAPDLHSSRRVPTCGLLVLRLSPLPAAPSGSRQPGGSMTSSACRRRSRAGVGDRGDETSARTGQGGRGRSGWPGPESAQWAPTAWGTGGACAPAAAEREASSAERGDQSSELTRADEKASTIS